LLQLLFCTHTVHYQGHSQEFATGDKRGGLGMEVPLRGPGGEPQGLSGSFAPRSQRQMLIFSSDGRTCTHVPPWLHHCTVPHKYCTYAKFHLFIFTAIWLCDLENIYTCDDTHMIYTLKTCTALLNSEECAEEEEHYS